MIYITTHSGEQFGPYGEEQLRSAIQQGTFASTDYGWKEGMEEWRPLPR
jgi:hypothetical protein